MGLETRGGDKPVIPDLQLIWTGSDVKRVGEILRAPLGEGTLKALIFWKGLGTEDREYLVEEGRRWMKRRSTDGWNFLSWCRRWRLGE